MLTIHKNIVVPGSAGKPMLTDVFVKANETTKPLIIYAHGFNGFKDWANFDAIASQFAQAGFAFVKFNFSHNGTTKDQPEDFADLEAFGNNNYSKELDDLQTIIDWSFDNDNELLRGKIMPAQVYLLGHSRGGGIVLLKAAEEPRVKKVATWASVSECKTPWGNWDEDRIRNWKQTGVEYYVNGRTGQHMPLYYQLYEDFVANQKRLDIGQAIGALNIPVLLCHGERDEAVLIAKAKQLKQWQPRAKLFTVDSDHVFGRRHPAHEETLPNAMQMVLNETIDFFLK